MRDMVNDDNESRDEPPKPQSNQIDKSIYP